MVEDLRMEMPREGLVRQELISYEKENGVFIKRTTVRTYKEDGDYQDHYFYFVLKYQFVDNCFLYLWCRY